MTAEPKISCRNVWKLYGDSPEQFLASHDGNPTMDQVKRAGFIPAVFDATIDVMPGEILILMGLSGSGKSTLVRCLSRLIDATAGEIFFDGRDLLGMSSQELIEVRRHEMGMVFQHFALLPHRTVIDNVAFPLEVQGVDRATRLERAREILALVGLDGRDGYYPRELSGGQQQRVGIGRSLAVEPDAWFLDEPFSALDPLIRRDMQDEFLRLQDVLQKTIVFITHDFDEAIRLGDRIGILYEGQIVQVGTAEELVTNPATDYVRRFTEDIQRDKILTVRTVMQAPSQSATGSVQASATVSDVAAQVLATDGPVAVIGDDGASVGAIDRQNLIDAIYGEPA